MQLECALFIAVVVGMACAIIAALSSLFWHSPDPKPHEKLLISNWKQLKKAKLVTSMISSDATLRLAALPGQLVPIVEKISASGALLRCVYLHRSVCVCQAKRSLGSIITTRATCPEKPWIAANQSLSSERMLTGYAAVIGMIKAAMIDEAIGRGSS